MKKYFVIYFFLNFFVINSIIKIALVTPYVYNENSRTLFLKNNLPFEIYTTNNNNNFDLSILSFDYNSLENYVVKSKKLSIEKEVDYILFMEVYSINDIIYVYLKLKSVNDNIVYTNFFEINFDILINETISNIANKLLNDFSKINLVNQKIEKKIEEKLNDKNKKKENVSSELVFNYKKYYKHEIFIQNGFFRNNPYILSFLSFYIGYTYYFSDNINLNVGFLGGFGKYTKDILPYSYEINDKFIGLFVGGYFFVKGVMEPNIGIRLEFNYDSLNNLYFSIPFDVGFKINFSKNNIIRFNSSFSFNNFDILRINWGKEFNLGFMIGYGFKI